jgi:hypothetical protein
MLYHIFAAVTKLAIQPTPIPKRVKSRFFIKKVKKSGFFQSHYSKSKLGRLSHNRLILMMVVLIVENLATYLRKFNKHAPVSHTIQKMVMFLKPLYERSN